MTSSDEEGLPLAKPGRYAIEGEIGRGGLGRVVRARDGVLDRPVALKELLDCDAESIGRFVREARITARLEHPGIVPVHDAARWPSGEPFIAMKLVSGRPLDQIIREAKTLDARLALVPNVLAVCEAVAYAHEKKIIHRDIKPANVMIGRFGETILIDWGLSKDLEAPFEPKHGRAPQSGPHGGETVDGAIMGTPAYMSPEQARGDPVDERTDVYALGSMLYEVLSGSPPHAAKSTEAILESVIHRAPSPLDERERGVPSDLVAVVEKSMAQDPAHRYRSGGELAGDLKRFLTGQLVGARRYTRGELFLRWVRRNRTIVAFFTVTLAAAAIGGTLAVRRIVEARDRAELAMHGAMVARRAESDRADDVVIVQARSLLERDPTAALAWLERLSPENIHTSLARLLALDAVQRGVSDVIDPGVERVRSVAVSPSGRSIAVLGADGTVRWWSLDSHEARSKLVRDAAGVRFDRTEKALIVKRFTGLTVLDTAGETVFSSSTSFETSVDMSVVHISADARRAVLGGDETTLIDLDSRTKRFMKDVPCFGAGISAHGRYVACGSAAGEIKVIDLERDLVLNAKTRASARHVVFSANEAFLAATGGDLVVLDIATGKQTRLEGHDGPVLDVALSSDGHCVVSSGYDRTLRVWNLITGRGSVLMRDVLTKKIQFAPDNVRVAVAEGSRVVLVDINTFARRELRGHRGPINDFTFTPSGESLVTASEDGTLRVWDVTPKRMETIHGDLGRSRGFALSATGWIMIPSDDLEVRIASFDQEKSVVLGRAEDGVASALFSPDGKELAISSGSGQLSVFDIEHPGTSKTLEGRAPGLELRAFDGARTIVTTDAAGAVDAWSLAGGARRESCRRIAAASIVAASLDGRYVAASVRDEESAFDRTVPVVALCDTSTGGLRFFREHSAPVRSIAVGHRLPLLAVGTDDGAIKVWDIATGSSYVISSHVGPVLALAFSADDALLASGSADQEAHVHALYDRSRIVLKGASQDVVAVEFSPKEDLLGVVSADGVGRVFDIATKESRVLHGAMGVERIAFSLDARWIFAALTSGAIKVFSDDAPRDQAQLHAWIASKTKSRIERDGKLAGARIAASEIRGEDRATRRR